MEVGVGGGVPFVCIVVGVLVAVVVLRKKQKKSPKPEEEKYRDLEGGSPVVTPIDSERSWEIDYRDLKIEREIGR